MIATKIEIKALLAITSTTQDSLIDRLIPIVEDDIREYTNNSFQDDNVFIQSGDILFTRNSTSNDTIVFNTWQHIAVTLNSVGKKIYKNGIDVTSVGGGLTALPPNIAGVVSTGNRANNTDRTFDGFIGDLIMSNIALTQTEIKQIFQQQAWKYDIAV